MRSETLLRLNRIIPSTRIKFAAALAADILGIRHLIVRMDPIKACNLKCAMCYFSDESYMRAGPVRRFSNVDIERLAEMFFPLALQLHIGCGTEPTMFKGYHSLVEIAQRHKVPFIGFTTNGLLLTQPATRAMIEAGLSEITLSTHGVTRETYESLMKGASFDKYHANLRMLVDLRKEMGSSTPRIRINYTVNASNLEELRDFFRHFDEYGIATLQVRPMDNVGKTAYAWQDMSKHAARYEEIVAQLGEECRARSIHLMANVIDPNYSRPNASASVYSYASLRYMSPEWVWDHKFDFRAMTYRQYQRQIGYRRELLGLVLRGDRAIRHASRLASSQLLS
jgi:MoaA/NifB/PqqE/SkfB family radical SAM enzyme